MNLWQLSVFFSPGAGGIHCQKPRFTRAEHAERQDTQLFISHCTGYGLSTESESVSAFDQFFHVKMPLACLTPKGILVGESKSDIDTEPL